MKAPLHLKILILIGSFLLISSNVWAEEGAITRFGNWLDGEAKCPECQACAFDSAGVVCPNTKLKDIVRPPFEIGLRGDFFATPTGGPAQFAISNFSLIMKHNFSPVFNVYSTYSTAQVEKTDYKNSLYDKTWHYQTFIVGIGWYVHPVIELFAGVGKVDARNSRGSEELGFALERGVRAHWPLNHLGYKINLSLISREVPLAEEGVEIERSPATATATWISAGITIPIGF